MPAPGPSPAPGTARRPNARPPALRSHLVPGRVRLLVYGSYGVLALAVLADLVTGPGSTVSPILACVPVLAGAGTRSVRVPLAAGAVVVALMALLARANEGVPTSVDVAAVSGVVAVTLACVANVLLTRTRAQELQQVRTVAEAAQRTLLRPVPERVRGLRVAVRYLAAAAEARIGGDLYEVLETDYGTRVLLGDVQGKGLAAVETAADVLGVFREAARTEPLLTGLAERLDAALANRPTGERFVTAVLLGVPPAPGPVEVVNCGHPPPLLRRHSRRWQVEEVQPPAFAPPLALRALTGGPYRSSTVELGPGDLLLLYTDGVSEARDAAGEFYPLAARLADRLTARDPGALLDQLLADVQAYVADAPWGGMTDDAALLALVREA
ncbi:serine/threonine-protein phosphatase [Streptomyces tateyamensis]|uniref:Serine/threonine-protein phosphatase n=1 Tax=Streptomyces tateyamensis TaxID=565073 RepID=A0A2V4NED9_9ACTN|nr:PP2C family protein-serine/threonine phosphatase [Streptomyces tateyamensis]PYC80189.1 serine/threonine-protein phosphatase [Streptomyces tateyamensis]